MNYKTILKEGIESITAAVCKMEGAKYAREIAAANRAFDKSIATFADKLLTAFEETVMPEEKKIEEVGGIHTMSNMQKDGFNAAREEIKRRMGEFRKGV